MNETHRDLQNFDELVELFASLPGVGKKSAMRFAYNVAIEDKYNGARIAHVIEKCVTSVTFCELCGGITEHELCDICTDETRDSRSLCIVESPKDIFLIENIKSFQGKYFVFSQKDFSMEKLIKRVEEDTVKELLFAFSPSIASDGLILYIEDKLNEFPMEFTRIAQGIPGGVSLENVDAMSLSRAIEKRIKI